MQTNRIASDGPGAVVDLTADASGAPGPADLPPRLVHALAVGPMGEEDKQRGQGHGADGAVWAGARGRSKPRDGNVEGSKAQGAMESDAGQAPVALKGEPESRSRTACGGSSQHGQGGRDHEPWEEADGGVRPCCDLRPSFVGHHARVAVVPHLLHVRLERSSSSVRHDVGRIHEQLVSSTLNLRVQHDVFCADAARFKETDFPEVGHPMGTIHARVMADGHQLSFRACAVTRAGGHEAGAKGHVSALCTEGVVIRGKVGSSDATDLRVGKPAHKVLDPIDGRDGVVVGEQDEVVVHGLQDIGAGIGPVGGIVVEPRHAVLFAHLLGVVLGLGIRDDDLVGRVGLTHQAGQHAVQFVGVVDRRHQHRNAIGLTVWPEHRLGGADAPVVLVHASPWRFPS